MVTVPFTFPTILLFGSVRACVVFSVLLLLVAIARKLAHERSRTPWPKKSLSAVPARSDPLQGSGGVGGIAALYARAMSSGFATKAGRSRRFGPNPKPDFSGDFHPASRQTKEPHENKVFKENCEPARVVEWYSSNLHEKALS